MGWGDILSLQCVWKCCCWAVWSDMNTEKYSEPKRPPLCLRNASKLTIQENNTQLEKSQLRWQREWENGAPQTHKCDVYHTLGSLYWIMRIMRLYCKINPGGVIKKSEADCICYQVHNMCITKNTWTTLSWVSRFYDSGTTNTV